MTQSFTLFCLERGVIAPPDMERDRWVRCPTILHQRKRNGAVKLTGDGCVGFCQNWEIDATVATWKQSGGGKDATPFASREDMEIKNALRRQQTLQAIQKARAFWAECKPLRNTHPYLKKKGLAMTGADGLRISATEELVIPMFIKSSMVSVQRIAPDGEKRFWFGAPTKGAYYIIERKGFSITLLAEGFATAATLFSALPNSRVIVAFNANNMPVVAENLKPTGLTCICADNDHGTESRIGTNPGLEAGAKAAQILGCEMTFAPCEGTDFNDWHQELMKQEKQADMFKKRKATPTQLLDNVNAKIRSSVMPVVKYIPPSYAFSA